MKLERGIGEFRLSIFEGETRRESLFWSSWEGWNSFYYLYYFEKELKIRGLRPIGWCKLAKDIAFSILGVFYNNSVFSISFYLFLLLFFFVFSASCKTLCSSSSSTLIKPLFPFSSPSSPSFLSFISPFSFCSSFWQPLRSSECSY